MRLGLHQHLGAEMPQLSKYYPRPVKNGSWARTLPYDGPCFWPATSPSAPSYLQKLDSPIVTICVGPDSKIFQIHKEMLVQSAHYFSSMFSGNFSESATNSASFPDDDSAAFELLIQWCYTGKLPSLTRQAENTALDSEVTKLCSLRLRLCSLAEKYGMLLLHNLAVDSIMEYLGPGREHGSGTDNDMRLEWKVFEEWCLYVYEHSCDGSPLRKFITYYLNFAIRAQRNEVKNTRPSFSQNQMQTETEETHSSGYSIDKLSTLANDIPDLTKDLFALMRTQTFVPPYITPPWESDPCDFHLHMPHSNSRSSISVQCPMSLLPAIRPWNDPTAKVQYYLQAFSLQGTRICYPSQVMQDFGVNRLDIFEAVAELVKNRVAVYVGDGRNFKLALPEGEEKEMVDTEMHTEVVVIESEDEAVGNLHSAEVS
ncbi:hypothetical protein VTL71DRAFT_5467 [Oculimacula yallundae]|uniref:BTB domain-containing protein n=1 Tax=Oculimacula yallundae TaxID=86028 RepID=A0ABR4C289_9HELO